MDTPYGILIKKAYEAREKAYSPYSSFKVGAAIMCADESIYTGCNIENASYGATCCAEKTAFFEAVKNGYKKFKAISIVGGKNGNIESNCYPCGICRQVMSEFCSKDFKIVLYNGTEEKICRLDELLPYSFSGDML